MYFEFTTIFRRIVDLVGLVGILILVVSKVAADVQISSPVFGGGVSNHIVLNGSDSRQQLLVTHTQSNTFVADLTRSVQLNSEPKGLVRINNGLVEPLSNGKGKIYIGDKSKSGSNITFEVKNVENYKQVNFSNSIVPLFTKHGCNGGGCHGKSGGQNGFKLSLLGFEPQEDFEYLLREARGRRLFPAAPERSLLLLKASGQLPHGGGSRIDPNSFDYKMIVNWMRQGMPFGQPTDPKLESIEH